MTIRSISYGGGVQSTAMIILAVQGHIDADVALFANVGDDSEHPATLEYVRNVMVPWAAGHGFPIHELQRIRRDGTTETLWQGLVKDSRRIPIPVRMADTGAPGNRTCTADWKMKVITRWLKANGATADDPAIIHIGISTDEIQRAGRARNAQFEQRSYPLLNLGLSRNDCRNVIAAAGLPIPGKSSCFFCPFHRPARWAEMRRDEPELFDKAQHLEDVLNDRRVMLGKDRVYLTRFGRRLSDAIQPAQATLFDDGPAGEFETCDEGVCFV